jgi:hypothetical protein
MPARPRQPVGAQQGTAKSAEKPSIIVEPEEARNWATLQAARRPSGNCVSDHFHSDMPLPVVLDTQVVLDWRYFGDPILAGWSVPGASWRWFATGAMRDELAHVLRRGFDARWTTPAEDVLRFFDAHSSPCAAAALAPDIARRLACRDPDDQKFIDLAAALAPSCLVSRDRAVLALARRAATLGVRIVPPSRWSPPA